MKARIVRFFRRVRLYMSPRYFASYRTFGRELTAEEQRQVDAWMDGVNRKFDELNRELANMPHIARDSWWAIEPDVGRVAHGVPHRVDRLKSLGNAVVPQIAEWIAHRIKAVMDYERAIP